MKLKLPSLARKVGFEALSIERILTYEFGDCTASSDGMYELLLLSWCDATANGRMRDLVVLLLFLCYSLLSRRALTIVSTVAS